MLTFYICFTRQFRFRSQLVALVIVFVDGAKTQKVGLPSQDRRSNSFLEKRCGGVGVQ
jgi:hypothetical protein